MASSVGGVIRTSIPFGRSKAEKRQEVSQGFFEVSYRPDLDAGRFEKRWNLQDGLDEMPKVERYERNRMSLCKQQQRGPQELPRGDCIFHEKEMRRVVTVLCATDCDMEEVSTMLAEYEK